MVTAICTVCQESYECLYPTRKRQCSTACRQYARKHPGAVDTPRVCELCAQSIPSQYRRATRFCSPTCSKAAGKRRRGLVKGEFVRYDSCQYCSVPMPTRGKAGCKYCSERCSDLAYQGIPHAERVAFLDRVCLRCKSPMGDGRIDRRFCSVFCQRNANADLRRDRLASLPQEMFNPAEIYDRDKNTCWQCGDLVDRLARGRNPRMATLDHVIPVNHPDCPGHIRSNVVTAHLSCNQRRQGRLRPGDMDKFTALRALYAEGGDAHHGRSEPVARDATAAQALLA